MGLQYQLAHIIWTLTYCSALWNFISELDILHCAFRLCYKMANLQK